MNAQSLNNLKIQRVITAIAVLLLVLGIGNLFYGSSKVRQYSELIEVTTNRLAQPKRSMFPLIDPTVDTSRDQQQLRRLRGSHQFYQFVQRAGGWMIFCGLLASAATLFFPAPAVDSMPEAQEPDTAS